MIDKKFCFKICYSQLISYFKHSASSFVAAEQNVEKHLNLLT